MSVNRKHGKLVSIGAAIYNNVVGHVVLSVMLEDENGRRPAKIIPAKGMVLGDGIDKPADTAAWLALDATARTSEYARYVNDAYEQIKPDMSYDPDKVHIRPAIGDTLAVWWDYGYYSGTIEAFAEDRSELIPWDVEPTSSRAFDAGTIHESLNPDERSE